MFTLVQAKPKRNGICCPRCSSELVDSPNGKMATGTRKEVECLICDYTSIYNTKTLKLEKNF